MGRTQQAFLWTGFLLSIAFILWSAQPVLFPEPKISVVVEEDTTPTITIASWNLQIFGKTKAANASLMNFYASVLDDYDILIVQEIREADGTAFEQLCAKLQNYTCAVSSRAGRSTSKEQYGVLYRTTTSSGEPLKLLNFQDFNPDAQDRWERSPIAVSFDVGGYVVTLYTIHTKPEDVDNELEALEDLVDDTGNVIVLGDLNADCTYYNHQTSSAFADWHWVLDDQEDTTVAKTDCAYDRILLNEDAFTEYVRQGIYSEGIDAKVSDHHLVWLVLRTRD